jgi:predicted ATPase with chaperone activity
MLSCGLTTILADMTLPEAIAIPRIHLVAGRTGARTALVTTRPCRAPLLDRRLRRPALSQDKGG